MNSDLSPDSYLQKGSTSVVNGPHKRMQIALLIPLDIMLNDIRFAIDILIKIIQSTQKDITLKKCY